LDFTYAKIALEAAQADFAAGFGRFGEERSG
jgi:hypothetical protein